MGRKALGLRDKVPYGNLTMAWVCLRKKMFQQATEYNVKIATKHPYWKSRRVYTYVKAVQREEALILWNELEEL